MIVVNTSFRRAPWADVLYACDTNWWRNYFKEAASVMGSAEMWTVAAAARDAFKINYIFGSPQRGLSRQDDQICTGMNSGYQAIGLAYLWGAARILLLGYDMMRTGGRTHWHPDHPRNMGNGGRFPEWIAEMDRIAKELRTEGVPVVNCSRSTALNCFPRSTIEREILPEQIAGAA